MTRRSFNDLTRHLVWEKLNYLISRYPGMSWSSIADEISDQQSVVFHRKYFERLRRNSLNDPAVRNIITWIEKYDPTFSQILIDAARRKETFGVKSLSYSRGNWARVSHSNRMSLSELVIISGVRMDWKEVDVESCALSFFVDAYALRFSLFSTLPSMRIYAIGKGSEIRQVAGPEEYFQNLLEWAEPQLSHINAIDYAIFYFTAVDSSRDLHFLLSLDDIDERFSDGAISSYSMQTKMLMAFFQPPALEVADDHFLIKVDCLTANEYHRLFVKISLNGRVEILNQILVGVVHSPPPETDRKSAAGRPYRGALNLSMDLDIQEQLAILRLSQHGGALANLLDHRHLSILGCVGSGNNYFFCPRISAIYAFRNSRAHVDPVRDCIPLAMALRFGDQHLLGLQLPDAQKDMLQYATVMHGKNLDAIIWTCKMAIEMQSTPYFPKLFEQLTRQGFRGVFEAIIRNASKEEVFQAYARS